MHVLLSKEQEEFADACRKVLERDCPISLVRDVADGKGEVAPLFIRWLRSAGSSSRPLRPMKGDWWSSESPTGRRDGRWRRPRSTAPFGRRSVSGEPIKVRRGCHPS